MSELEEQLAKATEMFAELQGKLAAVKEQESQVNYTIREKHRELSQLNSDRLKVENLKAEINSQLRSMESRLKETSKAVETEKEKEKLRLELRYLSDQFDKEMLKYKWHIEALPHQKDGAKLLATGKRVVLGDKRGLGKSLTSIAATDLVGSRKILAIVPNDVQGNFEREVAYWAPHRSVHILGGYNKVERNALLGILKDVPDMFLIINYEAWRKDNSLIQRLIECQFDTVIVDEAHMIKEMGTNAYKGVEAIIMAENQCPICGGDNFQGRHYIPGKGYVRKCYDCSYIQDDWGDFCSVKNVYPMTGTPILNKPQDIFPLLHLVNPRLFADKTDFLNAYCTMNADGKWVFKWGGAERLTSKLGGMYVARNRDQAGVVLPKQEIQVHQLNFEDYPEQAQAYKILQRKSALVVNDMLAEGENKAALPVVYKIALITRLRQMATFPQGIQFKHPKTGEILFTSEVQNSVKVDYVASVNGEGLIPQFVNDEQERVVVFSQFKTPLIEIERRLKLNGIKVVRYDGDTSSRVAQEVQIDFDRRTAGTDYKWDVVLCQYKKGGVGLNLNDATQTILMDEEWNPGKEDQAHGRTDRMGQTEESTVHVLRVDDTVDIWMASLIAAKAQMIDGFEVQVDLQQELTNILMKGE